MSERRRKNSRSLADLHEGALRETDAETGRSRRALHGLVRPESGAREEPIAGQSRARRSKRRPSRRAPAPHAPISAPSSRASSRWPSPWRCRGWRSHRLVPRSSPPPAPSSISPPSVPPPAAPLFDDPCRSAVRAGGDSPLVDDFEDGNELVALREARNGYWIALSDTDPEDAEPILLPSLRPDASPGNRYGLHLAGVRHRKWGASVQVELGPACYDASAYSGIAVDARGPGRLYAGIRSVDAVPVARGGTCTEDCYRSHLSAVTLESGWKTYVYPFGGVTSTKKGRRSPRILGARTGSSSMFAPRIRRTTYGSTT